MAQTLRHYAWELTRGIGHPGAILGTVAALQAIFRRGCRVDRRRERPAICHRLLKLGCEGLT